MFRDPIIITDSDPFIPDSPTFSTNQLDDLKRKYESPAQQPQLQGNKRQLADVINDEPAPVADPVAKTEPVAKPVVEQKIVTPGFTRVRKVKR